MANDAHAPRASSDPLGRRLGLNRAAVVHAAIRLADEDGISAISMSRVAESLGFKTMALYRHVASKEELLFLMHDVASQPPAQAPHSTGGGWRADLTTWCLEQQAVLRQHPWIVRLRFREWSGTPTEVAWMNQGLRMLQAVWLERGLRALDGTNLTERDKVEVLLLLYGLVSWEALYRTEMGPEPDPTGGDDATLGMSLRGVLDPSTFPALRRAVDAGAFDDAFERYGTLEFGLERVLDGVERLIARRAGEPHSP